MKIARLVGFVFVAVMALSLAAVSAAFAKPEFKPTGATFSGTSIGPNILETAGNTITCTANTSSGTISSATLIGNIQVSFTGCKSSKKAGEECTVKSVGGSEGLITTNTLHGVLGLILPSDVPGLLLLPATTKKFVTIASNKCTAETAVNGNIAGRVTPFGESVKTGKQFYEPSSTGVGESVKDIDLSTGGLVVPELEAFGKEASQNTTELIGWSELVEVT
jgi:hypothetical protein